MKARINAKIEQFILVFFIKLLFGLFRAAGGKNYLVIDFAINGERFVCGMTRREKDAMFQLIDQLADIEWELNRPGWERNPVGEEPPLDYRIDA